MNKRSSAPKPTRSLDVFGVRYSQNHWDLLWSYRARAIKIIEALGPWKSSAIVHGSLARGDVDEKSDIDILIPIQAASQVIEALLATSRFHVYSKEITQATPAHSPKAHISLDFSGKTTVTFPLAPLKRLEFEFYRFGGTVSFQDLTTGARRPGCTKRLTLVAPTESGHLESPIRGDEAEVARMLKVGTDIVRERIRVLTRRDKVGRTGVFLRIPIPENSSFEQVLVEEAKSNPALRRTLNARGMRLKG